MQQWNWRTVAARYFGASRGSRVRLSVLTGVVAKGATLAVALLLTPLLVDYLGTDGYGLFITITAVVSWLQLSNLGIGAGLQNALTEAVARGAEQQQRALVSTAFFILAAITVLLSLATGASFYVIPWGRVFPTDNPVLAAQVTAAVAIALAGFIGSFIISFVGSIFAAKQELHIPNIVGILNGVLMITAAFLAVHFDTGLVGVTAAMIGTNVLLGWSFFLWYLLRADNRSFRPRWRNVSREAWHRLSTASAAFLVIQICCVALFQTDYFIIAHFATVDAVTPYSIAAKPFAFLSALFASAVSQPLWAGYGNAKAAGDIVWIRRNHRRVRNLTMIGYAGTAALIVAFGAPLFEWWVGSAAAPSTLLILCTSAYFLIRQWTDLHAVLVNGLDMMRPQAASAVVHVAVTIGLEIFLIQAIGVVGVPIACFLGYALVSSWFLPLLSHRALGSLERDATVTRSGMSLVGSGNEVLP